MKTLQWDAVSPVRLEDLNPITRSNIAAKIKENKMSWKAARRGIEETWLEIDRHVNQYDPIYTPQKKDDMGGFRLNVQGGLGSKLKMVNIYAHREGLVSSIVKYLMENDYDFFDLVTADDQDEDAAMALKYYMLWLFDIMDFESAFTPFIRDIVHYGIAFASYEWYYDIETRWKTAYADNPDTGDRSRLDYMAKEILYDAPKFETRNVYHTVMDPTARDLRTAMLIHSKAVTPADILYDPTYKNVLDWKAVDNAPDFSSNLYMADEILREQARGNTAFSGVQEYKGKKEILEAWGDIYDGHTYYRNYVAEVFNGELVRFEPNPYLFAHKPFVTARYLAESGRLYGPSPLASIVGIQAGFDTIVNQYIDYWSMEINRPILTQANTIVRTRKEDRLKLPPVSKDAVWQVTDVNGIKRLDWAGRTGAMDPTPMLTLLQAQMERATGDNELNSGGNPQQYLKTGVAMTVADAGSTKLNMYAKTIEQEALIPVLEMTIDLLRQMDTQPMTFKRLDIPGETVDFTPAFLANNIQFSMRGASYNMTRQVQAQSLIQFLQQCFANPVTAQIINPIRAVIMGGEALRIRNVRELIMPQALQMLNAMQLQAPTLIDKLKGIFTGQQVQKQVTEQPPPGQQSTAQLAPAFGGANEGSTQPAAFDGVSAR